MALGSEVSRRSQGSVRREMTICGMFSSNPPWPLRGG